MRFPKGLLLEVAGFHAGINLLTRINSWSQLLQSGIPRTIFGFVALPCEVTKTLMITVFPENEFNAVDAIC